VDWLNPETWKAPAEVISDWRTIASVGLGLVTVVSAATKRGRDFFGQALAAVRGRVRSRQHADLRFVADDRETFWSIVKESEQVMSFHGTFHVTNVTDIDVCLLKFRFRNLNTQNHLLIGSPTDDDDATRYPCLIPGRYMSKVEIFCILRSLGARKPFVAEVIFTDNFGDDHRCVRFDSTLGAITKPDEPIPGSRCLLSPPLMTFWH
jgi:hypothetical protein